MSDARIRSKESQHHQRKMEKTKNLDVTRIAKCALSMAVFASSLLTRFVCRLVGRTPGGSCVVLYYHSILPCQRTRFARQLDLLRRHARPFDVTGAVELERGVDYVGVTFDDAFENFVDQALPELKKRKIPATMFVISGALGKGFGPAGSMEKVMSVEQLCCLPTDLVTIGSHTASHPFMPGISEEDSRRELLESKATLERLLNCEIATFSFPFGGFSPRLIEICRETGYRRVFTTLPVFAFAEDPDEFAVGRVRVDPTDWFVEFRLKLAGAYRWLPLAFALKRRFLGRANPAAGVLQPTASRSMIREWSGQ